MCDDRNQNSSYFEGNDYEDRGGRLLGHDSILYFDLYGIGRVRFVKGSSDLCTLYLHFFFTLVT